MYVRRMNSFSAEWLCRARIHWDLGSANRCENRASIGCGRFQRSIAMHRAYAHEIKTWMMGRKEDSEGVLGPRSVNGAGLASENLQNAHIVPYRRLAEQQNRGQSIGFLYHAVLKLYLGHNQATLEFVHHRHLPLPQALG